MKFPTLPLPAPVKGTFQGVSVIRGPLMSTPALGAEALPEQGTSMFPNGLHFSSVVQ